MEQTPTTPAETPAEAVRASDPSTAAAEDGRAPEAEPREEEYMTGFMRFAKGCPERRWNLYQIIGGIVLGSVCGALIMFFSGMESIGTIALAAAAVLALFLPQFIIRQGGRPIPKLRIWLIIALAAWMAVSLATLLISGTPLVPGK